MKPTTALFLSAGIAVLGSLFFLLKPAPPSTIPASTAASSAVATSPTPSIKTHDIEMVIEHGAKRSGPDVIQVSVGDEVNLKLLSDHADELHVHGYDLHADLEAGVPTVLKFKAERSGRFTMELHHSNVDLGALEVQPR